MHELSIALNIIDIAQAEAENHGGGAVRAVHIKLGPLSGLIKEALLSAYQLASEGSPLADSQLVVEETPIVIDCEVCAAQKTAVSIQSLVCSDCLAPAARIVHGRELEITALEIEE